MGFPLLAGDPQTRAQGPREIVFIGKGRAFPSSEFKGLVISEIEIPPGYKAGSGVAVVKCAAIKPAMAQILPLFDQVSKIFGTEIHPDASIDPSAKLGKGVRIAARAVVQAGAVLGDQVALGPGAVIEAEARVGARSQIHSNVVIGFNCEIGSDCILHSGTVIGSDGFGFVQSTKDPHKKIPQIGNVIIGNQVEFGANCAVDRGTLGSTTIGDGCKFDNLCHIAHNCRIGKQGLFAGGFFISGSSTIDDFFTCGGSVVIADHINITHHVTLGGRSAVTKDITESGAYTGYPLEPIQDGLKTIANLRELTSLRKKLGRIMKHLGLKEEGPQG